MFGMAVLNAIPEIWILANKNTLWPVVGWATSALCRRTNVLKGGGVNVDVDALMGHRDEPSTVLGLCLCPREGTRWITQMELS
jgi:hypothetical protein